MEIKLTEKQFRRLLDLVYIGNWVLNSTRGDDRIRDYDQVESLIFSYCLSHGMAPLTELSEGELIPSRAFADGGIHEAIMAYEDNTFFEILAQELALRDMDDPPITQDNYDEVMERMNTSRWIWTKRKSRRHRLRLFRFPLGKGQSPFPNGVLAALRVYVPKKRRTLRAAAMKPVRSAVRAAGTVYRVRRIPAAPK